MILFYLISRLPFFVLYRISDLLYLTVYKLLGYRKKVVFENLKNSFPEKSDHEIKLIAEKFYKHLGDIMVESIKLLTISESSFRKRISITNIELPLEELNKGQSIIVLTGHSGNWEWLLQACQFYSPTPISGVYKPLATKFFDKLMLKIRGRFNAEMLPIKDVPRAIVRNKGKVWSLAMVADQTPLKSEIQFVNTFLNQRTPWFIGGERIAKMANMPVFYVGMTKSKRGRYEVYFEKIAQPPFEKTTESNFPIIQGFSELLEKNIQEDPAHWLWSHRRWKHKV